MGYRLSLICLSLAGCALGFADVKSTLQANYNRLNKSVQAHNAPRFEATFRATAAPGFRYVNLDANPISLNELTTGMKGSIKASKQIRVSSAQIQSVTQTGNTCVANVVLHVVSVFKDGHGKDVVFNNRESSVDTWVRSGKSWKLREIRVVKRVTK